MRTEFAKYEGAGNDFILIDTRSQTFTADPVLIARLCDRHFGIGADGLMTLSHNAELDGTMRYYNADGSEGEMCGNGARCFALFIDHLSIGGRTKYFDARDGIHTAHILHSKGPCGVIELGITAVNDIAYGENWWFLNTGVPHYVEFVDDLTAVDVDRRGRSIRNDLTRFPEGTNVNFVQITGNGTFQMRTYERGVEAETLACGTGATAAAIIVNYVSQPDTDHYRITVPGGELKVCFTHQPATRHYNCIRLSGPARRVFSGTFDIENFQTI